VHSHSKEAKGLLLVCPINFIPSRIILTIHRFSVPHDRLFFDALERDIKRESMGTEPASAVSNEPALSFKPNLSSGKTLWEVWMSKVKKMQESGELMVSFFRTFIISVLTF
jgi:hypothetical protein